MIARGSMHAVCWMEDAAVRGFLNMYLDAHTAEKWSHHLLKAAEPLENFCETIKLWAARDPVDYRAERVSGGDRSFV